MHSFWSALRGVFIFVCFLLAGLSLSGQNPDSDPLGQQLNKQAQLDRDAFGAGPKKSVIPSLDVWALNSTSDLRIESHSASFDGPEDNPALAGTQTAAEMFLKSELSTSDLVAVGTVTRQPWSLIRPSTKSSQRCSSRCMMSCLQSLGFRSPRTAKSFSRALAAP